MDRRLSPSPFLIKPRQLPIDFRAHAHPYHRVGHFIYYDPLEVREHIQSKLKVPARG